MEEILEEINNAKEELKRVDHLIFVSLKYTRTVDVLKNVITRLMNSFGSMVKAILLKAKAEKKIDSVPIAPLQMCEKARELSEDKKTNEIIDFYSNLRKISKIDKFESENEYRRYVRMIVDIDGKKISIEIDSVSEYYKSALDLVAYLEESLK